MIQFIRDHAKGVIAWIIIILVTIPFALWGVNEYFQGGSELPVARVGKRPISAQEFQQVYQRELGLRRQILGSDFIVQNEAAIKRAVLDGLVSSEVMVQAAGKAGFRVSDDRVGSEIRTISQFHRDGKFDPELYAQMLRGAGLAREQFEDGVRRDLLTAQLTAGLADSALVTEHELDRWLRLSEQQRKVGYYLVKAEDYLDRVAPSDAEIRGYYEDNLERFALPERVKAAYVELSLDSLKQQVKVDEEILRRLYEEQAGSFAVGEQRRARHILIKVAETAGADAVDEARVRAEGLRARIAAGESFAALAREFSDDKGSAQDGGELGFFDRGVMVSPFEEAAFAMKKGELSAPVRTPFGWHIIEVEDVNPGSRRSFSEVRAGLEEDYRRTQAEEQLFDLTENLTNLTYEHPDTLKFASEELGLPIQTTGLFARDQGDGVAANENFRLAAFGEDVIDGGNNSEAIQFGDGRVVVLRIVEKQPATHRPLDEVTDRIRLELIRQGAQRLAEEAGKAIRERMHNGDGVEAIAREFGAVWRAPVLMGREDAEIPAELLDTAFTMERPAQDRPTLGGVQLAGGDFAVLALYEVVDGNLESVTDAERRAQRGELQRLYAQRTASDLLAALRARAKVSMFEDRL
ncbi:MAG: SurA N-terminal domain-containing protein [Gammaproteobacteria bacterium]|nr:SurA N-terminal domain-containing protein [Gammaproteobacteria bacterium]